MAQIGKPEREYTITPAEEPVPEPIEVPERRESPAPTPEPAREPVKK